MTGLRTIGFIGFGEAGFEIAKGLAAEGPVRLVFFRRGGDPARDALAARRAAATGARPLASAAELAAQADAVLSVVPPDDALAALGAALPGLGPGKFYLDLTSSFPDDMREAARRVEAAGAVFVDGAMAGALPVEGHRVLVYASGRGAAALAERLGALGMNLRVTGEEPGQASAIKLILSIATKGIESLLVEMFLAARHFRAEEEVMRGLERFFARGLEGAANRFVGSDAVHAGRRVHEMASSVRLLERLGIEPLMTRATVERLRWSASLGLSERFGGVAPAGYREVIRAWEEIGLIRDPAEPTGSAGGAAPAGRKEPRP